MGEKSEVLEAVLKEAVDLVIDLNCFKACLLLSVPTLVCVLNFI